MTEPVVLRQRSLPDQIRYFSRLLAEAAVAADDRVLVGRAMALAMVADQIEVELAAVRRRADEAETDRARLANIVCGLLGLRVDPAMPGVLLAAMDRIVQDNGGHPCEQRIAELAREVSDLEQALRVPV